MTDSSKAWIGAIAGAVVGGAAAYLFFTEQGRSFRSRLEPMVDEVARELGSFRHVVEKAVRLASQGGLLPDESLPY